jgi:parallel beta-helix repeat protein
MHYKDIFQRTVKASVKNSTKERVKAINPTYLLLIFVISCGSDSVTPRAINVDNGYEIGNGENEHSSSGFVIPSFTTTLYIDATLANSCDDYNLPSRTCGSGRERAFSSIAASAVAAAPGVNFQIRGGDYNEMLHVNTSGTPDAYLGYTAYDGEVVTLLDADAWIDDEDYGAIWLDHVSYVWLNEIDVRGSVGFGRLLDSHHNIISNSDFSESRLWGGNTGASKRGGLYVAFSHYNRLLNNRFYKGTDSLALIHSDYNLIEGNTMDRAGHDIWNIKCGSFNIVRNNKFSNEDQKLGSVFDCEAATMSWYGNAEFAQDTAVVDRSQHNLIEGNIFRDTVKEDATGDGNGIQYAGQNGIIRRNLFYRANVGIDMASYRGEATYNYGNRIYNNVFHDNGCAAIVTGKPSLTEKMTDNAYLNNIIWDNQGAGATNCTDKNAKQILWRAREDGGDRFVNNDIASRLGDEVLGGWGTENGYTIAVYENRIDAMKFRDNLAVDPLFVNESDNDYRLHSSSPMVDAAAFLTTVRSVSGSGTTLQLADVNYFYDGFGIPGEVGDTVQVDGRAEAAIITNINYENKTITLDTPLTWQQGDGIGLSYKGAGPDLGAFEHE